MATRTISVALPVCNAEAWIRSALDSILDQTHSDFEVIAVDDGSSDATPAILGEYTRQDSRIRSIRTPNRGITAALNTALAESKGHYLARMDADDICEPTRFEVQAAHLDAHDECVVVGSEVTFIDANGAVRRKQPRLHRSYRQKDRCRNFTKFPPSPPTVPHPTAMMRTSALKRVGGYRPFFLSGAEDRDLWWRLMPLGEIDRIPLRLLRYRVHAENRSSKLSTGVVADALVSDFSAIARHFGLDDTSIIKEYPEQGFLPTLALYDALIGKRYPVLALARHRVISRRIPSILGWTSQREMRRDAYEQVLRRPTIAATWRVVWAAARS